MMTPKEISFLLNVDEIILTDDINTIGHPARKAFFNGVSTSALQLRENIREAAIAGSPFSIAECQKLIMNQLSEVNV
ncbi:hypothetical protein HMPREF3034_00012 [Prevotella sp. DNF00663]|nr:hypothetical protein HMPREF3034_00012 [Prevotella sp. DNF00663]